MNIEEFIKDHQLVTGIIGAWAFINVILAHRALNKIMESNPALLKSVGIVKIDWWIGCVVGIIRLGFLKEGRGLPASTRFIFQAVGGTYFILIIMAVASIL
ncbi:hypothetical protein [Xanthomonas bonasiae]|uniref:hypothetical protein n=1 Tax=Xanthomonas bonasiae TaxID=2810351 RepID=UPI0019802502|nr:hypothetical protein [Xanthomonas bonasiae]MBN6112940.1 hypothetical protein [Xanthomonas bonasiae]